MRSVCALVSIVSIGLFLVCGITSCGSSQSTREKRLSERQARTARMQSFKDDNKRHAQETKRSLRGGKKSNKGTAADDSVVAGIPQQELDGMLPVPTLPNFCDLATTMNQLRAHAYITAEFERDYSGATASIEHRVAVLVYVWGPELEELQSFLAAVQDDKHYMSDRLIDHVATHAEWLEHRQARSTEHNKEMTRLGNVVIPALTRDEYIDLLFISRVE